MKTYYYNIEDAEFMNSAGEKISRCIPELCYQEHARWKIFLRDRNNGVYDLSDVIAWSAAVDCDFRAGTPPLCRTLADGIDADATSGSVTVTIDAATAGFLTAVDGRRSRNAEFELCGFDADGNRLVYLSFAISARMTLDPDPEATTELPETLATKSFVSSLLTASASAVLADVVSGALVDYPDSGAVANTVSGALLPYAKQAVVASSDAVSAGLVLSGGTSYIFTSPMSALNISGAVVTSAVSGGTLTTEAHIKFTLASGGSVTITPDVEILTVPDFTGGKTYAGAVNELGLVMIEKEE